MFKQDRCLSLSRAMSNNVQFRRLQTQHQVPPDVFASTDFQYSKKPVCTCKTAPNHTSFNSIEKQPKSQLGHMIQFCILQCSNNGQRKAMVENSQTAETRISLDSTIQVS